MDLLKNILDGIAHVWNKKTKNPYLFALKNSKYFIVTSDSTSMISECAFTGKPIYVAQMPAIKNNKRFKHFFNLFETLNITKNLQDSIEYWEYEILDETNKISSYIKEKIYNYDFS